MFPAESSAGDRKRERQIKNSGTKTSEPNASHQWTSVGEDRQLFIQLEFVGGGGGEERQICAGEVVWRWLTVSHTHKQTHTHTHTDTHTHTRRICWLSFASDFLRLLPSTSFCHSLFGLVMKSCRRARGCAPPTDTPGQALVCYHWKPLTHEAGGGGAHGTTLKTWSPFTISGLFPLTLHTR